ncbi:hypothetical protein BWI17_15110 [Betaproteobacteria bacterium GR16-43]|nr:hypothetical protein BWI17_15110 [Betaproteobacteria bacterium GR16-43]
MRAFLFLLAALASLSAAAAVYDAAAWDNDATTLGFQVEAFDKCRGRMAEKPRFKGCLQMWEDAKQRVSRMDRFVVASPGEGRAERMAKLRGELEGAIAFLAPEVKALGRVQVAKLMANDKALAPYRKDIEGLMR